VSNSRHKVDEAKSSLAADKSENAVLASLNKLKAQGRIKGFHVRIFLMTGVAADVRDVWATLVLLTTNTMLPSLPHVVPSTI
jgi:structural maintenance of chromosome 4